MRIEEIRLGPNDEVNVVPEYSAVRMPRAQLAPAVPFEYGSPNISASATALLLTGSKEAAEECREEYGSRLATLDTKIPFPPEFLREALLRPDDSRRVDTVILDVSQYPGAFKHPAFWQDGPGDEILREFKQAGGTVRQMPSSQSGVQRE